MTMTKTHQSLHS